MIRAFRWLRLSALLLALLIAFSAGAWAETLPLDASGALYILQRCVGLKTATLLDTELEFSADADQDGTLTSADALKVLQAAVKLCEVEPLSLTFDSEILPIGRTSDSGARYSIYRSEFQQWVESNRQNGVLSDDQANRLQADYGVDFFKENALLWAIDSIPASGEIQVDRLLCAQNRFLVTLADGENTDSDPSLHLVLIAISQDALRQTGLFEKMDVGEVLLHRAATRPYPGGVLSSVDYPAQFEGNILYEIRSTEELLSFAAQKKAESDTGFAGLQNHLIPRNSDAFFRQYRTFVFEVGCLSSASDPYTSWSMEDNTDGTKTLVLSLPAEEPPAESVSPEDETAHGGIAQRLTFLDLPAEENPAAIAQIRLADGQLLWEANPE